jgi:hypothetical protein
MSGLFRKAGTATIFSSLQNTCRDIVRDIMGVMWQAVNIGSCDVIGKVLMHTESQLPTTFLYITMRVSFLLPSCQDSTQ